MKRSHLYPAAAVSLLAALLCASGSAFGAISVNTTVDSAASGSECLGAPGDCSIRQAIDKASPGDTITVPAGTYLLTSGSFSIAKNLTITGAGARSTTVSGNGLGPAFSFITAGISDSLSGMTITGGHRISMSSLGGGAVDSAADLLTLDHVNLSGTTEETTGAATARGGAITVRNNAAAVLSIVDSTIAGNVQRATGPGSNQGGALFASGAAGLQISNSTIAGNLQQNPGGGSSSGAAIYAINTPTTLTNVTVAGNSGAKALEATVVTISAKNTIVANGAGANCGAGVASLGHNLENANECGFASSGDQVNKDPLLGPLADNGGPTDTEALLAGSPAIDAGDPAGCPAADQRGVARPAGACDVGAFEYVPAPPPDKTPPSLAQLTVAPSAFKAVPGSGGSIARKKAKTGTGVSYSLDEAATVTFTAERLLKGHRKGKKCVAKRRKGKRCKFYKSVKGSFSRSGPAGANQFKFTGRVNGRRLSAGSYRLVAVPKDAAGNVGATQLKSFKIKR